MQAWNVIGVTRYSYFVACGWVGGSRNTTYLSGTSWFSRTNLIWFEGYLSAKGAKKAKLEAHGVAEFDSTVVVRLR